MRFFFGGGVPERGCKGVEKRKETMEQKRLGVRMGFDRDDGGDDAGDDDNCDGCWHGVLRCEACGVLVCVVRAV